MHSSSFATVSVIMNAASNRLLLQAFEIFLLAIWRSCPERVDTKNAALLAVAQTAHGSTLSRACSVNCLGVLFDFLAHASTHLCAWLCIRSLCRHNMSEGGREKEQAVVQPVAQLAR